MPDTPVAAPAAPAAAPSSAPASTPTPAAAPAAPISTPAAPASVPTSTSTSTPTESNSTAAAPTDSSSSAAPAEKPGKPERSAYGDNIEKFLRDTYAWEAENPDGTELVTGDEIPAEPDAAVDPAEATTPEDAAADPNAEAKPEDAAQPAEVDAPTPEGLSKIFDANPDVKAVLEAHPEVKGQIYAMARQNAKAAPILEVFPNVEAAKFAQQSASEFVGMKTAFQLSDSPEKMADAAQMFLEQFKVVDDKGAPVLDAAGKPTYGDDLSLFTDHIKERDRSVRMEDLKQRIATGQYASAQGREMDEQLLAAYEFIAQAETADPADFDKPDTSQMTPEMKAYFDKRDAELNAEKERLGLKDKQFTKKQQTEARAKYDAQYREQFGSGAAKYIANYLKQKEESGVVLPHYFFEMKDRDGMPAFFYGVYNKLNETLANNPAVKAHAATLQMNSITDQGLAARLAYGQSMIDEYLPGIIDSELKKVGLSVAADAQKKIADRDARRGDARVEPAAGSPATPRTMTDVQLMAKAKENVAAKLKGQYIDPAEKMRLELTEKYRLEAQRA